MVAEMIGPLNPFLEELLFEIRFGKCWAGRLVCFLSSLLNRGKQSSSKTQMAYEFTVFYHFPTLFGQFHQGHACKASLPESQGWRKKVASVI